MVLPTHRYFSVGIQDQITSMRFVPVTMEARLKITPWTFICGSLVAQEELFTCTDIDSGGFYYNGSEYKLTLFNLSQFDIKIDFDNRTIESPDLLFEQAYCLDNSKNLALLTCSNRYGQTFMINALNYEFTYSTIFGHVGDGPSDSGYADSIGVRFGTCREI